MAAKRYPQQGTNNAGADSFDPKGYPANAMGPSANMGSPGGGGSPQFDPRNGFVQVVSRSGTGKIGVPTALKWRWAGIGIDSFNVIP